MKNLFQHPPGVIDATVVPLVGHGIAFAVADEPASAGAMAGIVGTGPTLPNVGNTLIVGTAAAELTPRLPISVDPNGIPVRATPPGAVGDVDVGVGDEAMLVEPEPHIPDSPDVSSIPEVVDTPDVADIADVAAVAGVAVPTAIPPPSKLAVDPNIPEGEVPMVEHVVPLLGIEMVPVTPTGAGLTPGDTISVEPRGMPVWETAEPAPMPSGEVAAIVGVGLAIPVTCAMAAALQRTSVAKTEAINDNFILNLLLKPASKASACRRSGARLCDVDLVDGAL